MQNATLPDLRADARSIDTAVASTNDDDDDGAASVEPLQRMTTSARMQRAAVRLPELREMLDAQSPALQPGQAAFCSDGTLMRFLASCSTTKGALAAINSTLRWRTGRGFDSFTDLKPRTPYSVDDPNAHCVFSIGKDTRGWEIIYCCPPRGRLKDPTSCAAHFLLAIEAALERAPIPGTGKFVLAVDLHGLGLRDLNPKTGVVCAAAIMSHYPGEFAQCVLLDSALVFKVAWAGIQVILDKETADKVKTLRGSAMETYFEQHLDAEQADFMRRVLKMAARPGSYPESVHTLTQPFDNPQAPTRVELRKLLAAADGL